VTASTGCILVAAGRMARGVRGAPATARCAARRGGRVALTPTQTSHQQAVIQRHRRHPPVCSRGAERSVARLADRAKTVTPMARIPGAAGRAHLLAETPIRTLSTVTGPSWPLSHAGPWTRDISLRIA
jgi:hypothetical protein